MTCKRLKFSKIRASLRIIRQCCSEVTQASSEQVQHSAWSDTPCFRAKGISLGKCRCWHTFVPSGSYPSSDQVPSSLGVVTHFCVCWVDNKPTWFSCYGAVMSQQQVFRLKWILQMVTDGNSEKTNVPWHSARASGIQPHANARGQPARRQLQSLKLLWFCAVVLTLISHGWVFFSIDIVTQRHLWMTSDQKWVCSQTTAPSNGDVP